jgi:hypothetical protein
MALQKSMQELEHQRSFVRVQRIVIVPLKLKSNHHGGIKRDLGSLDRREVEQGSSDEGEEKVKSQLSDLIGDKSTVGRNCGDQEGN